MLARHPEVFTLPETAFFQRLLGDINHRLLGDVHHRPDDADAKSCWRTLERRLGFTSSIGRREFVMLRQTLLGTEHTRTRVPWSVDTCINRVIAMLDGLAERAGRSAWIEKTPHHLLYLSEIEHYLPDARVLHVIRPGIDVLASINDAYFRYEIEAFSGSLMQWVRRWNRAVEIHRSRIGAKNHHFVFLENLIHNQAEEWRRLCEFLGLSNDVALDDSCQQNIADLKFEPWKHGALSGLPQQIDSKAENLFGPQLREWLRERLSSYEELYAAINRTYDIERSFRPPASVAGLRSAELTAIDMGTLRAATPARHESETAINEHGCEHAARSRNRPSLG